MGWGKDSCLPGMDEVRGPSCIFTTCSSTCLTMLMPLNDRVQMLILDLLRQKALILHHGHFRTGSHWVLLRSWPLILLTLQDWILILLQLLLLSERIHHQSCLLGSLAVKAKCNMVLADPRSLRSHAHA